MLPALGVYARSLTSPSPARTAGLGPPPQIWHHEKRRGRYVAMWREGLSLACPLDEEEVWWLGGGACLAGPAGQGRGALQCRGALYLCLGAYSDVVPPSPPGPHPYLMAPCTYAYPTASRAKVPFALPRMRVLLPLQVRKARLKKKPPPHMAVTQVGACLGSRQGGRRAGGREGGRGRTVRRGGGQAGPGGGTHEVLAQHSTVQVAAP